jgi:hypothetical protein
MDICELHIFGRLFWGDTEMRKFLIALLAAATIGGLGMVRATAAPVNGAAMHDALKTDSMVQDARVYCYNRYSGRFLHWGPCGGYWHPHYYHRYYYHRYHYHRYHYRHW